MRARIAAAFVLISFVFLVLPAPSVALADDACRCKGCGCKGGPGWRGPDGFCVPQGKLADICGSPPAAPCKQEGAPRVCFGKEAARAEPGQQAAP
jgi:hypothetical protein